MTSRELVRAAIDFTCPQRIPITSFDENESDIILLDLSSLGDAAAPDSWKWRVNKYKVGMPVKDEWGCIWKTVDKTMGRIIHHPLSEWENFDKYHFPDPKDKERFEEVRQKKLLASKDKYFWGRALSPFTRMMFLRGYSKILEDLFLRKEKALTLADKVFEYEAQMAKEWAKIGIDGLEIMDDWGTQNSLMISPGLWREIFKPRYERLFNFIHTLKMDIFMHSDGQIYEIISDLIQCGVDALEVTQPNILGIEKLGKDFGGKVCFYGLADKQKTLVRGTPTEIRREVKRLIDNFGQFGGGYIAHGQIQDYGPLGIPEENIRIMYEAYKEFGKSRGVSRKRL